MAADLTGGNLVFLGWAVMMVAAAFARLRFERLKSPGRQDLAHALESLELRRGVVTVVHFRVEGLPEKLEENPTEACRALELLMGDVTKLAGEYRGEVEVPGEDGFRVFLGRYLANPDHRASALELALRVREATTPLLSALELQPFSCAVVTDDAVSSPFQVRGQLEVRTFGKAIRRATELAGEALPGEIRVDAERGVTDSGFDFVAVEGGRVLAGRKPEPEPEEVSSS